MPAANYLRVINCEYNAAKRNGTIEKSIKIARTSTPKLPIYQSTKLNLQIMTNIAGTDYTFRQTWCKGMVEKN